MIPNPPFDSLHNKDPLWQKDKDAKYCFICRKEFGIFLRRHHCRHCGNIFCDTCCPINKVYAQSERLCSPCEAYFESKKSPSLPLFSLHDLQLSSRKLGSGSFGYVIQGTLKKSPSEPDLPIALKRSSSSHRKNPFKKEVVLQLSLNHPNVLGAYGYVEKVGPLLELASFSLDTLIYRMPQIPDQLRSIIYRVYSGLKYLEEQRVVHRDLKPQNILLDNSLAPKIADFGTARRLKEGLSVLKDSHVCTTYEYAAPEVMRSFCYSPESDLYALAIIIWEMFIREKPFQILFPQYEGDRLALQISLHLHANKRLSLEGIPKDIETIITLAWAQNPEGRQKAFPHIQALDAAHAAAAYTLPHSASIAATAAPLFPSPAPSP